MKKQRTKIWADIPDVPVYQPNLDAFYKFMYERHMIYVKRFVRKEPPPWTDNPILRDYKFTNVYRELDYGTIWYLNSVAPLSHTEDSHFKTELLWLTVMYRLVNRVETFEKVGLVSSTDWRKQRTRWKHKLEKLHEEGPVFTNAHLTLPTHEVGLSKIEKYIKVLNEFNVNLKRISKNVFHDANSLEDVFNYLMQIDCVGRFIAYEIACDLVLTHVVPFSENSWVNPGPGCKHGLRLIFPRLRTITQFQNKIKELQNRQVEHFSRLGLSFPYLYPHTPLTLRSVEHSLCEFQKMMKMIKGIGKQRMYFKPRDWTDSKGQLPFRFPR